MNTLFRANIRWQTLAEPFLNYCDGVHTPLFEEFSSGVDAISATCAERKRMFADPKYRDARCDASGKATGAQVFHRNLAEMWVVSSPDAGQPGKIVCRTGQGGRRSDPLDVLPRSNWPSTTRPCAGRPW